MPRLLHHHHRLLARPNRRHLRWMFDRPMSTYRRQGTIDGGVQFQEEVDGCMGTNGGRQRVEVDGRCDCVDVP